MPSGLVHDEFWRRGKGLAPILAVASALITDSLPLVVSCNYSIGICVSGQTFLAFGVVAGYWYGRYITPDADIAGLTTADGYLMNHFPIIGNLVVAYWTIYGTFMRRHHRSWITHGPVVSTFIRHLFGFWWTGILMWNGWWGSWATYLLIGSFLGTCIPDTIHWWLDKTYGGE